MNNLLLYDKAGMLIADCIINGREIPFTPRSIGTLFRECVQRTTRDFIVFEIVCGPFSTPAPNDRVEEAFGEIVSAHEFDWASEKLADVNRMRQLQGLSLLESLNP